MAISVCNETGNFPRRNGELFPVSSTSGPRYIRFRKKLCQLGSFSISSSYTWKCKGKLAPQLFIGDFAAKYLHVETFQFAYVIKHTYTCVCIPRIVRDTLFQLHTAPVTYPSTLHIFMCLLFERIYFLPANIVLVFAVTYSICTPFAIYNINIRIKSVCATQNCILRLTFPKRRTQRPCRIRYYYFC